MPWKTLLLSSALLLSACASNNQEPTVTPEMLTQELSKTEQTILAQCTEMNGVLLEQNKRLQDLEHAVVRASNKKVVVAPVPAPKCPKPKANANIDGKTIVGDEEWVMITPPKVKLLARVDTGAAVSSIHATDIVEFERDGDKWVKFNIAHADGSDPILVESKVIRVAEVKKASAEEFDKRPVVRLNIKLGPLSEEAEFNLKDRGHMTYPVLLGREFLKDITLVDTGKKQIHTEYKPKK